MNIFGGVLAETRRAGASVGCRQTSQPVIVGCWLRTFAVLPPEADQKRTGHLDRQSLGYDAAERNQFSNVGGR